MQMTRLLGAGLAAFLSLTGMAAVAQDAPEREITRADGVEITLHRFAWLRPDDLATLEAIAQSAEARAMLLGPGGDFAALALAPADGLLSADGVTQTAQAVAQLPDAETARLRALELCDGARKGGRACVIVFEVAPLP
jgi:hypothetical protein